MGFAPFFSIMQKLQILSDLQVQSSFAEKEMAAYGKAGAIAEEALSGIRTVVAFGGQLKEVERYAEKLIGAKKSGILRGMLTGVSGGLMFGIMYCVYALGFWYGVKTIMDDRYQIKIFHRRPHSKKTTKKSSRLLEVFSWKTTFHVP